MARRTVRGILYFAKKEPSTDSLIFLSFFVPGVLGASPFLSPGSVSCSSSLSRIKRSSPAPASSGDDSPAELLVSRDVLSRRFISSDSSVFRRLPRRFISLFSFLPRRVLESSSWVNSAETGMTATSESLPSSTSRASLSMISLLSSSEKTSASEISSSSFFPFPFLPESASSCFPLFSAGSVMFM